MFQRLKSIVDDLTQKDIPTQGIIASPNKEFLQLSAMLKREKILPLKSCGNDEGMYVHKSKIDYPHSLLISPDGSAIYALVHHPIDANSSGSGKKVTLGQGFETMIREAVNVRTGEHVAIKMYPLYAKQSSPLSYSLSEAKSAIAQWKLTKSVNSFLPNTFVKLHESFFAGDKSSLHNESHKILYVVTDKMNFSLTMMLKNENMNTIRQAFINIFSKHKKLFLNGYTFSDNNAGNILFDDNHDPVFCDPDELIKHGVHGNNHARFRDVSFNMLRTYFGSKIPSGNREKFDKICDRLQDFLIRFIDTKISEDYITHTFDDLFKQIGCVAKYDPRLFSNPPEFIPSIENEDFNEVKLNPTQFGYQLI